MRKTNFSSLAALAFFAFGSNATGAPPTPAPRIEIVATTSGPWKVRYELPKPTTDLVFERSPDDSRAKTWTPSAGFAVDKDDRGEFVHRLDGTPFQSAVFAVPAVYRELPKDYGPFAPFGDGGMLFHSGRFFACAGACSDSGTSWRVTLRAPRGRRIVADGRISSLRATWNDDQGGRYIYIGRARPVATATTVAVIDRTLPDPVRKQLDADLPRYLRFFASKLGALPERPALFVSYDEAHANGWGRQGGVLPGQIFVHFYGRRWPVEMAKPAFGFDLAWHLAHESGHFYQRGITEPDKGGMWVHEGGAEAFAALAVVAADPGKAGLLKTKIGLARSACKESTRTRSLRNAIQAGDYKSAYSCGLLLNLALHNAVIARTNDTDGLFAIWRAMLRDTGSPVGRFDRALASVAGHCVHNAIITATFIPNGATADRIVQC